MTAFPQLQKLRRCLRQSMLVWLCAMLFSLPTGCVLHHWKHRHDVAEDDVPCTNQQTQIPRRFFVAPIFSTGVASPQVNFAAEVVAALNALPNSTAIMLPPNMPIQTPPEFPPGPSPELLEFVSIEGPSAGIDELLIIHVTDAILFRPMRLSAILERRSISNGLVLDLQHRTWNAPVDMEPLSPNPFNRFILNHPPPVGLVEHHELSRVSPVTFQRNVAETVALELANSPF